MNDSEQVVWDGSPSQWTNFSRYLVCGLLSLAVVPAVVTIPMIIWRWLVTRCTRYELTSERLRMQTGVLNRSVEELELYRVKDSRFSQTFLGRMVGIGDVTIYSTDSSTPVVMLKGVADAQRVRESLRNAVEARRDQKRVRVSGLE